MGKRIVLPMAVLMMLSCTGLSLAQPTTTEQPGDSKAVKMVPAEMPKETKLHHLAGEVVAVDPTAKTVTIKHMVRGQPKDATFNVAEKAGASLATLQSWYVAQSAAAASTVGNNVCAMRGNGSYVMSKFSAYVVMQHFDDSCRGPYFARKFLMTDIPLELEQKLAQAGVKTRRFRLRVSERKALLLLVDLAAVNGALCPSPYLRTGTPVTLDTVASLMKWFITLAVVWFICALVFDCYNLPVRLMLVKCTLSICGRYRCGGNIHPDTLVNAAAFFVWVTPRLCRCVGRDCSVVASGICPRPATMVQAAGADRGRRPRRHRSGDDIALGLGDAKPLPRHRL